MSKVVLVGVIILALIIFGTAIYFALSSQQKKTAPTPVIQQSPNPTQSTTSLTPQKQIQKQSSADQNFSQKILQTQQDYPWYTQLPLQTTDYFVYFNLDSKEFIAKLYPKQSSSNSIDNQVSEFKAEITVKLKNIGVDTNQYNINWEVNSEP